MALTGALCVFVHAVAGFTNKSLRRAGGRAARFSDTTAIRAALARMVSEDRYAPATANKHLAALRGTFEGGVAYGGHGNRRLHARRRPAPDQRQPPPRRARRWPARAGRPPGLVPG